MDLSPPSDAVDPKMVKHLTPPYPSLAATLGGIPSTKVDVPIASVFIVLYFFVGAANLYLGLRNKKRGHRFYLSRLLIALSVERLITMSLRIAAAYNYRNIKLELASGVFTSVGTILLYIVNLVFAERILRATHPHIGWSKIWTYVFVFLYALLPILLIIVIVVSVEAKYTLDLDIIKQYVKTQLGAQVFLLFIVVLPQLTVATSLFFPRRDGHTAEQFGKGSLGLKSAITITGSFILSFALAFRVAIGFTNFYHPKLILRPPWYDDKALYWCLYFVAELVVLYFYLIVRVDLIFHIPDKAGRRKTYLTEEGAAAQADEETQAKSTGRIDREETRETDYQGSDDNDSAKASSKGE